MNKSQKYGYPLDIKILGGAFLFNKKIVLGFVMFFAIVLFGFIKINIINTKALSPIGNGEDNYELVKEEFGKDFEEFIKDKSEVKIYTKSSNNENTIVKILNKEYIVKTDNVLTRSFYNLGELIYNNLSKIANNIKNVDFKISKDYEDENTNTNTNEELDKAIDEFLKSRE